MDLIWDAEELLPTAQGLSPGCKIVLVKMMLGHISESQQCERMIAVNDGYV